SAALRSRIGAKRWPSIGPSSTTADRAARLAATGEKRKGKALLHRSLLRSRPRSSRPRPSGRTEAVTCRKAARVASRASQAAATQARTTSVGTAPAQALTERGSGPDPEPGSCDSALSELGSGRPSASYEVSHLASVVGRFGRTHPDGGDHRAVLLRH